MNLNYVQDKFVGGVYVDAIKELSKFFDINWAEYLLKFFVVSDRNKIYLFRGKKTQGRVVGWFEGQNVFVYGRDF